MPPLRIAALLTCHNRREKTVECLRALRAQVLPGWNPGEKSEKRKAEGENVRAESGKPESPFASSPESLGGSSFSASSPPSAEGSDVSAFSFQLSAFLIEVFLVDDGSTDGTAEAVREVWPDAKIIQGNGNLYWCGGMRVAWCEAAKTDPDYYLLLNDDTQISIDAVTMLLNLAPSPCSQTIAVAPIKHPITGDIVCGGRVGVAGGPVVPSGTPAECDTMNANCALVTKTVFQKIGMFHNVYTHAMGDLDYGFLAKRSGIRIVQAGKVLGCSVPNSSNDTWRDIKLCRWERLRLLYKNPKGLPFFEWLTFCYRNYGPIWAYRAVSPALRILAGK